MKKYIIPLEKLPNQTIRVELDGKNCNLTFITRDGKTYLNEFDVEDEVVLCGVICLNETDILKYQNFNGKLYFKDLNGYEEPYYTGFNDRFVLIYEVV